MKRRTVSLLIAGFALTGFAVGIVPCAAQSENWGGPQSAIPPAATPPSATVVPAAAPPATAAPAASGPAAAAAPAANAPAANAPAANAKKTKTEVLPWANQPTTLATETPPVGDQAALQAAAAQCSGLFEAACRDLKTCAWIADVVQQDGTRIPARCLARPPAPPKSANKAANKPKKAAATNATAPQAPAVKAAVTRIEDTEEGDKPAKQAPAAVKNVEAKATPPVEETPQQQEAKQEEKPKDTAAAAQAPIVVAPPKPSNPASGSATTPSFGSVSPIMPGAGDGVVVTVPSGSSQ